MEIEEKQKGRYKIINKRPTYSSEEERQEAYKKCALEIAIATSILMKYEKNNN